MQGTMLVYRPELPTPVRQDIERQPELPALQKLVGGYIEAVPFFLSTPSGEPCVAFCNEDGKRLRLPFNRAANEAWRTAMERHAGCRPEPDYLVGTVVVLTGNEAFMRSLSSDEDEPEE